MISKYGIIGTVKLGFSLLFTKMCYPKARLIRLPVDIRNKKLIAIGDQMTTGIGCRFEAYPSAGKKDVLLKFGKNIEMNDHVHITAMEGVTIGDNVLIASKVYISDCAHGIYGGEEPHSSPESIPNQRVIKTNKVTIEDNVWIGEFVSVLPGVTIGRGSIIGTMSVVSKSIPPYSIAVGAPAKVIKTYNFERQRWEKIISKKES